MQNKIKSAVLIYIGALLLVFLAVVLDAATPEAVVKGVTTVASVVLITTGAIMVCTLFGAMAYCVIKMMQDL